MATRSVLWRLFRFFFVRRNAQSLAIHQAAGRGDLQEVQALLTECPGLVNCRDERSGHTPLHWAAYYGQLDVVKWLSINQAEIDARCDLGGTPLECAVRYGHKEIVEFLLRNGADINAKDVNDATPLHTATRSGSLLREHGARP
jgi:ankyrin repeat protein